MSERVVLAAEDVLHIKAAIEKRTNDTKGSYEGQNGHHLKGYGAFSSQQRGGHIGSRQVPNAKSKMQKSGGVQMTIG